MDKILIVDDDSKIRRILSLQLKHNGYEVDACANGEEALTQIHSQESYKLVLVDIMLPGMNGIQLCREIKKKAPQVKVIMVSAKDTSKDVVSGLNSGADDYIKKPFVFDEVLARIRASLRSLEVSEQDNNASHITYREIDIDMDTFEVRKNGQLIELSKTEFDLFYYLIVNNNIVQSRMQILNKVWGYDYFGNDNIVDVYIKYLRDKIDAGETEENKLIHTVRGRGYVVK